MGAWSSGPFDNDDAADFVGELCKMTPPEFVAAVLGDALLAVTAGDGYIEAPEMSRAVAAAAIVALFGGAGCRHRPHLCNRGSTRFAWSLRIRFEPRHAKYSRARSSPKTTSDTSFGSMPGSSTRFART
jgi:hypothetical protein